ncbi:NAD(P)-dependent dehydrogenase (short-subunit alcohol dehydrogenase family) [Bradyrhizobium sp. F1.13.1]
MNCSSLGGLVGLPNRAAYHGSKHGVLGLTKCAALDFATKNIRVNAVCPGTIETPMSADRSRHAEGDHARPVDRPLRPSRRSRGGRSLCSDAASFVVGVALPVDGGFTMH